uniref:response regulator transcription factor n=1 Tax=Agathobacter sp. TaxID=2021311 RepID=UPI00405780FA
MPKNTDIKASGFCENGYIFREMDTIKAVAEGLYNKEIANKLFITEGTVKNYITSIFADSFAIAHGRFLPLEYFSGKIMSVILQFWEY